MGRFFRGLAGLLCGLALLSVPVVVSVPRSPPPRVVVAPPPPPPPPVDAVLEAVELELASRLVGVAPGEAHDVAKALVDAAREAHFDPWFIVAVIEAESMYRVEACSPTGALGLMQLMPATFRSVSSHYRMTDPVENIRAGVAYLAKLYTSGFKGPTPILMAYNGGPGAAAAYWRAARTKEDLSGFSQEMTEYPSKVLARYRRLVQSQGGNFKRPDKTWRTP